MSTNVQNVSLPQSSINLEANGNEQATSLNSHPQDTLEMNESSLSTACFCSSIFNVINCVFNFVRTKFYQSLGCFFPNGYDYSSFVELNRMGNALISKIRSNSNYNKKLTDLFYFSSISSLSVRSWPTNLSTRNSFIREAITLLPDELSGAIAYKYDQLCISEPTAENRIEISLPGRTTNVFSRSGLNEAIYALMKLYPDDFLARQLLIIIDEETSKYKKIESLNSLVNFDLNIQIGQFNLRSTKEEEDWIEDIKLACEVLPTDVKAVLYAKMPQENESQEVRGLSFLSNPRSPEAKRAIEETLQEFSN